MKSTKDLNYYKNNCIEDYVNTPISVLRYISELEEQVKQEFTPEKQIKRTENCRGVKILTIKIYYYESSTNF